MAYKSYCVTCGKDTSFECGVCLTCSTDCYGKSVSIEKRREVREAAKEIASYQSISVLSAECYLLDLLKKFGVEI